MIDEETGGYLLEYSRHVKIAMVIFMILCWIILSPAILIGPKEPGDPYIIAALIIFLGGSSLVSVIEAFLFKAVISEKGIKTFSPWKAVISIGWSEVDSVTFNTTMNWYKVRSNSGSISRIGEYISGRDIFERKVCEMLPYAKYCQAEIYFMEKKENKL